MKQHYMLKRFVSLVAFALAFSAILIAATFAIIAPRQMMQSKIEELRPQVQAVSLMVSRYLDGLSPDPSYFNQLEGVLRARIFFYDSNGREMSSSADIPLTEGFSQKLSLPIRQVLAGQEVAETLQTADTESTLCVGAPIYRTNTLTREKEVVMAVFLLFPAREVTAALSSLNITLLISIAVSFAAMLFLSYAASRHITQPMIQMQAVALSMAGGDFTARADEQTKGEIGQLGQILNYLAGRLGDSVTAIISERNRLLRLFDGLNEGLLAVDAEGNLTHANPAFYTLFGLHPQRDGEAFLQEFRASPSFSAITDVIQTRRPVVTQAVFRQKTIRILLSPLLDEGDACSGVVCLLTDISEQERLEQTRRDYVANVSHELKTPVSSLIGLTEALQDGLITTEEDRARYYGLLLKEAHRLSRLIEDLLELSRLQAGQLSAELRRTPVHTLVAESLETFHPMAEEGGISLVMDQSLSLCPPAYTNFDRMEQVLVILTDNALKFTERGGSVTYRAKWDDASIQLSVADTGRGIHAADLPHIFDRFYKVDIAYSQGGTGLGLSIAKEALALLGEEIGVTSVKGSGTTFTFTMRRYPEEEA